MWYVWIILITLAVLVHVGVLNDIKFRMTELKQEQIKTNQVLLELKQVLEQKLMK